MSKLLDLKYDGKNRAVEAKQNGLFDVIVEKPETGEKRSFKQWEKKAKEYFCFLVDNHNP